MKTHRDPVTGDELTTGEYISWKVQGLIRKWHFLVAVTIITIFVWTMNDPTGLLWWNLGASYLAIVIESIVGLSMFAQTKRDAVVMRETRNISKHIEEIGQQQLEIIQHIEQQFTRIKSLEKKTGILIDKVTENNP